MSEANRQTESKDPYDLNHTAEDKSFRIAIRFFDEHNTEFHLGASREAATECSLQPALSLSKGRKPWVQERTVNQPRRGERNA